jgi:hypothetical protein
MSELSQWGLFLLIGVGTFAIRLSFIAFYGSSLPRLLVYPVIGCPQAFIFLAVPLFSHVLRAPFRQSGLMASCVHIPFVTVY